MAIYIGFDVHSQQTTYYAIDQDQTALRSGQIETTAEAYSAFAREMLKIDPVVEVAMETGTQCRWAALRLQENGLEARVFHATEVAAYRPKKKQKNDMNDAKDMAHGMRNRLYRCEVYMPTDTESWMRKLCEERIGFVDIGTAEINKAKNILRGKGLPVPVRLNTLKVWEDLLEKYRESELYFLLQLHYQTFRHSREMVKLLEEEIVKVRPQREEEIELLETIPCVGKLTAFALMAAIGDVHRFSDSAKLSSYFGVVPSSYDSGKRRTTGTHITRTGPSYVRRLLCECAHQAMRSTNPFSAYYYAVNRRSGNRKKAIVAVMHRIVRVAYQVLKTRQPFDAKKLRIFPELIGDNTKICWRMGIRPSKEDGIPPIPSTLELPQKPLKIRKKKASENGGNE